MNGTNLPGVTQRHHVINVNIARCRPCGAVVRAEPTSRCRDACSIGNYVGAIALQHGLARVARAGLRDPVREQVARVTGLRALSGDGEACELRRGLSLGGNIRGRAGDEGCWGGRNEGNGRQCGEDGGLHDVVVEVYSGTKVRSWARRRSKYSRAVLS